MTVDEAMNLAVAHHQAGRLAEAEPLYRQVLAAVPDHPGALHLLGVIAHQVGRSDAAIDLIGRSIQLAPCAAAYSNLGEALRRSNRLEEAVAAYREAIRLEPEMASAYSNLGLALHHLRRFEEAERVLLKAIELDPTNAAAHQNLCNTLGDLGKVADAVTAGRQAVELGADTPAAWSDLGVACVEAMDLPGAREAFERSLALDPSRGDTHHNLAQVLLRAGDFARGWDEYEWRWRCKDFPSPARQWGVPQWDGGDLTGRTILLHAEQGLGDAIMFARYVPLVLRRGPARVVVECQPEIVGLMRTVAEGIEVVARGETVPAVDSHCPFMSLPRAFGTRVETVPADVPYLRADTDKFARWADRLGQAKGMKVGIVWAGRPAHKNDHNRSTSLSRFGRLAMEGVTFYSLQVGPAADQAKDPPAGMRFVDLSAELIDYAETAAVLEALDLVIAVDTSIVHAAGALGRDVWVLLPFAGDWRWIVGRDDSPWYPTMRLFRQQQWGDWDGVFARVRAGLAKRVAAAR
jgi:Flp pilus assembly protein TadD